VLLRAALWRPRSRSSRFAKCLLPRGINHLKELTKALVQPIIDVCPALQSFGGP
jgi:hypothetical protein